MRKLERPVAAPIALRDFSLDDLEEWEREISAQVEGYDCAASARELWRPWV